MGYLNRVVQLDFPELAGTERPADHPDGPGRSIIWLTIRNPKLIAGGELMGGKGRGARANADGSVVIDSDAAEEAYEGFARLIIGGHVLDPTVDSDEPPALPMPPAAGDIAKYPIEVLNRLGKVMKDGIPR